MAYLYLLVMSALHEVTSTICSLNQACSIQIVISKIHLMGNIKFLSGVWHSIKACWYLCVLCIAMH